MPAYVVAICHSKRDEKAMERYIEIASPTLAKYEAKFLAAYTDHEDVESAPTLGTVLIEFKNFKDVKEWYHSPEYQAAIPFRKQAGDYTILLVDGVPVA